MFLLLPNRRLNQRNIFRAVAYYVYGIPLPRVPAIYSARFPAVRKPPQKRFDLKTTAEEIYE